MKRLLLGLIVVSLSSVAAAQDPFEKTFGAAPPAVAPGQVASPSDQPVVQQTPELYMTLKMLERHDDPKNAIRRKAETKAAERRGRLAAQKWYGYSQSRPASNALPWMGNYSQKWVGNGVNPYHWVGHDYFRHARVYR